MDEKDIQVLKEIVYKELMSCGYFMGDFNIHNLPKVEGWKPYPKGWEWKRINNKETK
jgi:hypothetical protein